MAGRSPEVHGPGCGRQHTRTHAIAPSADIRFDEYEADKLTTRTQRGAEMKFGHPLAKIALCATVCVGSGGLPPRAAAGRTVLQRAEPVYAGLAREMRLHGDVILLLLIEADGAVGNVKIESGHPILATSAVAAARQWKFAPATTKTAEVVKFSF